MKKDNYMSFLNSWEKLMGIEFDFDREEPDFDPSDPFGRIDPEFDNDFDFDFDFDDEEDFW